MPRPDTESVSSRLRHRVLVEHPPGPEDRDPVTGEPVEAWSVVAACWADVREVSGRELVYAQQVQAESSTVVEIRYRPGVDRTCRVEVEGRKLNVDAVVDPDSLGIRLLLFCREES